MIIKLIQWPNSIIKLSINYTTMNTKRLSLLPAPIITQQIIFSHRSRQTDSSLQASFLKLSEKNSLELRGLQQNVLFQEMANRLNELQHSQTKKLDDITYQIRKYEQSIGGQPSIKKEQKENQLLTYRKLKPNHYQNQLFQSCNFEMDEHFNYVNNYAQSIEDEAEGKNSAVSMQNSKNRASFVSSKKEGVSRLGMSQNDQLSPLKSRLSQKGIRTSRTKRKTTVSSCKQQTKRGRVYEQILSLYTTAKLLAMQRNT